MPALNSNEYETVKQYGAFLDSKPWDFFVTLTTKYDLSVESGRRLIVKLHNNLLLHHPNLHTFFTLEPFDTKDGRHVHGLISFGRDFKGQQIAMGKRSIKKEWEKVAGKGRIETNFTVIRDFVPQGGAHIYVAKYLYKPGAEYDYFIGYVE
jgi:hypothetical protein